MADIAKLEGVAIANLAKAWGTSVSALGKILGLNVVTGPTITAGSPTVFETGNITSTSVCMADSTHAIVTYKDGGNSNYGTACLLTLSGTTITAETPVVFSSSATSYTSVCMLDSTHAIVSYSDPGNSSYGTACCLSLSGTTITSGTPVVFESASTIYISSCTMDSTHAIVTYKDGGNSSYGTACLLTLSGTTITAETPVVFVSSNTSYTSVCMLDSTHAIVSYSDLGNSSYGTACCLSLSGTTITSGTPVVFESASTAYISSCTMDSTHAISCYKDVGNSSYGTACGMSLSGTTITVGTPVSVGSVTSASYTSVCMLDATNALMSYSKNALTLESCHLSMSGTTITAGTPVVVVATASTSYVVSCAMDSTHAIIAYANQPPGTSRCITLS